MNKILYHPKEGTTGFFYGDFPSMPMLNDRTDKWYIETGGYLDPGVWYTQKFEKAKQEAINNGEIVNIELLSNIRPCIVDDKVYAYRYNGDNNKLLYDDTFDLPEGVQVEPYSVDLDKKGNVCYKGYRLVKEKEQPKQESQEDLWAEIINDARWYDGSPQDLINMTTFFKIKFTIQRK